MTSKAAFLVAASPAVLRAALRLARLNRRLDLRELADRLRDVPSWNGSYLANPPYLAGAAHRLRGLLPPPGFGPCLKHSLLLLDLWSRCDLEPRLHLGTRKCGEERQFHAWITAPEFPAAPGAVGYDEIWSH